MQRGVRLVVEGAERRVLEFDVDVVLGRGTHADIRFPLPQVSSEHIRIFQRDGAWWVEDLASKNGSLWNGMPLLPAKPVPLEPGGKLRLGPLHLWVELATVSQTMTMEISETFSRETLSDFAAQQSKKAPRWALVLLMSVSVAAATFAAWLLTLP